MYDDFYANCIMEDRKSRQFLNFKGEAWFENFLESVANVEVDDYNTILCSNRERLYINLGDNKECRKKFSLCKEILDLLISLDICDLECFLKGCKPFRMCLVEENKKRFPVFNLPLIRMLDYFLEKCAFPQFAQVLQYLEYPFVCLWFELTYKKVIQIINENKNNPNLLYIFTYLIFEDYIVFLKKEHLWIIENAPFEAFDMLFQVTALPAEYMDSKFFFHAFKRFDFKKQMYLLELIEKFDYDFDLLKRLHKLLNKDFSLKGCFFPETIFEMSKDTFHRTLLIIENSSYFKKNNIQDSTLWKLLKYNYQDITDLSHDYYSEIIDLYCKCREYATTSIVNSLLPLNQANISVEGHYNILVRVRTIFEAVELTDTFERRIFCSFSIITEKNMSHYSGKVLYGYYTNVSAEQIAHIYPCDSLSIASAKYEYDLTKHLNLLLDIDDLNQATLEAKTYNQLCIRTKTKAGKILWPDCIICIDQVNEASEKVAKELGLKILVLHKGKDTIENNDDIYADVN